ncbi:MAG: hypothetical protein ABSE51_23780 [Terracidiphilus sp.]
MKSQIFMRNILLYAGAPAGNAFEAKWLGAALYALKRRFIGYGDIPNRQAHLVERVRPFDMT